MNDYQVLGYQLNKIKKNPYSEDLYKDALVLIKNFPKPECFKFTKIVRDMLEKVMSEPNDNNTVSAYNLWKDILLFEAPYLFDSYCRYLEIYRKPQERFYEPRRLRLKPIADIIQDLIDDKLDEVFISQPARTGKTGIMTFFVSWIIGRTPNRTNLYTAFSDTITSSFYNGVLEIITDPDTYAWNDVFPGRTIEAQNSKDETLDIDRRKHYPSLTCRSLYGTLNGACDCDNIMIADDLISGIEEASNQNRLDSAWDKVTNNLIPRAKESAKKLWIGTRWSMFDPIGRRLDFLHDETASSGRIRYKEVNIPALELKGEEGHKIEESNFIYDYGVGFSTQYFQDIRASFAKDKDMASWFTQYQGEPMERVGMLFDDASLSYYDGTLPIDEKTKGTLKPDSIMAFCDVAWGGGDFLSMPIAYVYDQKDGTEKIYIHDVVFNDGHKEITWPLVIDKLRKNNVSVVQFERNNGGEAYEDHVREKLKAEGFRINISSIPAPSKQSKLRKIITYAPNIRKFIFIDDGIEHVDGNTKEVRPFRSQEYQMFMHNLISFRVDGKSKHDDAADSLAGLAEMAFGIGIAKVEILDRRKYSFL